MLAGAAVAADAEGTTTLARILPEAVRVRMPLMMRLRMRLEVMSGSLWLLAANLTRSPVC